MTTDWSEVAKHAIVAGYDDAWVMGGARTPFADYCGVLAQVNPIDLGIKAARAALDRSGTNPEEVRATFAATVSPGGFDYLFLRSDPDQEVVTLLQRQYVDEVHDPGRDVEVTLHFNAEDAAGLLWRW